jgi:hypothetical protein
MIILPIETEGHAHDTLVIVLDKGNVERMKLADPAEIPLRQTGRRLVNPLVLVCYEDDTPEFVRLVQGGDVKAIIKHLQRGWKFQPERGDHDRGPESIGGHN